jgi:hypothetical protein
MGELPLPPWTYIILERYTETATVCVCLLAAALHSQGSGKESIEALAELPGRDSYDGPAVQRDALLRLQALIHAETARLAQ